MHRATFPPWLFSGARQNDSSSSEGSFHCPHHPTKENGTSKKPSLMELAWLGLQRLLIKKHQLPNPYTNPLLNNKCLVHSAFFICSFASKANWHFLEYIWSNVFWTAFTLGVILWSWVSYSWLHTLKLQFFWAHFNAAIYIQNKEAMVIPSSEILMSLIFCHFHHVGLWLP